MVRMGDKSERRAQFLLRKLASGKITESEHQELTKLALEDPFLSEAIDGYRADPISHATHLALLRHKLDTKTSSSKARLRWSVAAGFLLIIGVGLPYYLLVEKKDDATQLAMENITQERDLPSEAQLLPWQNEKELRGREGSETSGATPGHTRSDDIDGNGDFSLSKQKEAPPSHDIELPEAEWYSDASPPGESQHKKSAEPRTNQTDEVVFTQTEIEGVDHEAPQTSRLPTPPERAAGVASRAKSVEVTPHSDEGSDAEGAEIRPIIGWKRFKEEVQGKLVYPPGALKAKVQGVVTLSFYLSAERRPTDIKVLQSLGFGCDQEAIRLLEKGPRWQGKSDPNRRITIDIPFTLPKPK